MNKFSIAIVVVISSFTLISCFESCAVGDPLSILTYCDYDKYQKSIKPYIAYWHKDGMNDESRLQNWVTCGGFKNGSFGINIQDKLPGESQVTSQNRQQMNFQRCMIRSGYSYKGNCSSDWAKTQAYCGAP